MGEVTLKVPAIHVKGLRDNVYARFATEGNALEMRAGALGCPGGRSWDEFIADDDPDKEETNIGRYAVDVLKATRNIAALVAVMDQLDWTDPIEGALEIVGDAELLESLVAGYLIDLGDEISHVMDDAPTKAQAIRWDMERIEWCLSQHDALQAGAA